MNFPQDYSSFLEDETNTWNDSIQAEEEATTQQRLAAAEDEIIQLRSELADALARLIGCDGDEGRDTTDDVSRWEAITGDYWQGS